MRSGEAPRAPHAPARRAGARRERVRVTPFLGGDLGAPRAAPRASPVRARADHGPVRHRAAAGARAGRRRWPRARRSDRQRGPALERAAARRSPGAHLQRARSPDRPVPLRPTRRGARYRGSSDASTCAASSTSRTRTRSPRARSRREPERPAPMTPWRGRCCRRPRCWPASSPCVRRPTSRGGSASSNGWRSNPSISPTSLRERTSRPSVRAPCTWRPPSPTTSPEWRPPGPATCPIRSPAPWGTPRARSPLPRPIDSRGAPGRGCFGRSRAASRPDSGLRVRSSASWRAGGIRSPCHLSTASRASAGCADSGTRPARSRRSAASTGSHGWRSSDSAWSSARSSTFPHPGTARRSAWRSTLSASASVRSRDPRPGCRTRSGRRPRRGSTAGSRAHQPFRSRRERPGFERPHGRWSPFVSGDSRPRRPRGRSAVFSPRERDPSVPLWLHDAEALRHGVPGEALLDAFRREATGTPLHLRVTPREAFSGGWGLYAAAACVTEGGVSPGDGGFGVAAQELVAFVGLAVDVGLHDRGWSHRQALDAVLRWTPLPEPAAKELVLRSICDPGRVALRRSDCSVRAAHHDHGAARRLVRRAGFHAALLEGGPIPMSELDARIDRWLQLQRRAPRRP